MVSCLVVFYGILTLVGYVMANPVYTYELNIHDLETNNSEVDLFFKQTRTHLFAHS